jgi:hypothetical protein
MSREKEVLSRVRNGGKGNKFGQRNASLLHWAGVGQRATQYTVTFLENVPCGV